MYIPVVPTPFSYCFGTEVCYHFTHVAKFKVRFLNQFSLTCDHSAVQYCFLILPLAVYERRRLSSISLISGNFLKQGIGVICLCNDLG